MTNSTGIPGSVEEMFASQASVPSVKFPTEGTSYIGTVLEQDVMQQREFNPDGVGDLKFWDDGKPMMQVVLTCKGMDGEVAKLYVKGRMLKVAKAAVREAGLPSFVAGTEIGVVFTETLPTRAKVYTFQVTKGTPPAVTEVLQHDTSVEDERVKMKEALAAKAANQVKPDPAPKAEATSTLTEGQTAALKAAGLL